MVYIGNETFKIYGSQRDIDIDEPIFECDELLADTIQNLNKKGYKTKHCCSGHIADEKYYNNAYGAERSGIMIKVKKDICFISFENSLEELKQMGLKHINEYIVPDERLRKIASQFTFGDDDNGNAVIKREFDPTKSRISEMIDCSRLLRCWAGWQKPVKNGYKEGE